jgi:lipopolysaccharide transport system ATP-binding protein
MKPILEIKNLSKEYAIGANKDAYLSLRDLLSFKAQKKRKDDTKFLALNDVSFDVNSGESIGIIGKNGAGKSTLLKVLSKITPPTKGKIICRGRIASLLEVGTGFHPELTGRENIFMNGSILGMRKVEIEKHFDAIVDFSGVEKFLDTPLKRYSSGMQLRLAFAVAAHLEPEILIIDEVLAVGDAAFQKKCLGKMSEVSESGRTVLFVSHDMNAIKKLCKTAILLDGGKIIANSEVDKIIPIYLNSTHSTNQWQQVENKSTPHFSNINLMVVGTQPSVKLKIEFEIKTQSQMKQSFVAFNIQSNAGTAIGQAIPNLNPFILLTPNQTKTFVSEVDISGFIPGTYLISAWIGAHNNETYDHQKEIAEFTILDSPQLGRTFPHTTDHGYYVPSSKII